MSRRIRKVHPNKLVEVTCRTMQGRFLLKALAARGIGLVAVVVEPELSARA